MRTLGLLLVVALVGCSDDSKAVTVDQKLVTADVAKQADTSVKTEGSVKPDNKLTTEASAVSCTDILALQADALANGTKVLKGVSLPASAPISYIIDNLSKYASTPVRIDGFITSICQVAGCWAKIIDTTGKTMAFKVVDGNGVDFRDIAKVGQYAVGEGLTGTVAAAGGPVIWLTNYGAMIGKTVCPLP